MQSVRGKYARADNSAMLIYEASANLPLAPVPDVRPLWEVEDSYLWVVAIARRVLHGPVRSITDWILSDSASPTGAGWT